jgi:hypothetical protein
LRIGFELVEIAKDLTHWYSADICLKPNQIFSVGYREIVREVHKFFASKKPRNGLLEASSQVSDY